MREQYHVYAFEADGAIYVGETGKPVKQRLREHAYRCGMRWRPRGVTWEEMCVPRERQLRVFYISPAFPDRESAKKAEAEYAAMLRAKGHTVKGGH